MHRLKTVLRKLCYMYICVIKNLKSTGSLKHWQVKCTLALSVMLLCAIALQTHCVNMVSIHEINLHIWALPLTVLSSTYGILNQWCNWNMQWNDVQFVPGTATYIIHEHNFHGLHSVGIYYPSLVACKSCTISLLIQVFQELNLKAYDLNVDNLDVHAVSLSYTHLLLLFPDSSQASLSLKRSLRMRL